MNSILRGAVRSYTLKAFTMQAQQTATIRSTGFTRSLWHMSKPSTTTIAHNSGCMAGCSCGCGKRFSSTSG